MQSLSLLCLSCNASLSLSDPAAQESFLSSCTATKLQPSCQLLTHLSPLPLCTASISLSLWLRLRLLHSCTVADWGPCTPQHLLRDAKLVATPDDSAPAHPLASCLMVLFNAAFSTGQALWSLKTALVTPFLKLGNATDTANRPPSVSEPISMTTCRYHGGAPCPVHRAAAAAIHHPHILLARAWHHPFCLHPSACH